ncbi:MAG: glutamate--cysteine ligase [Allosphingosinicella sp.]
MTTRTETAKADPPIEGRDDLLRPFAKGEKPATAWRIGTEHEKFVYRRDDHRAPSYDEPGGIRDLLDALTDYGWEPVEEGGKVIALSGQDGNVSLEPAGQLELSGAPLEHLHQTCAEAGRHLDQVKAVGDKLGLDMMLRTCTIQVNLDYASEADMVQKFRVGLALQPLATALFANSPFTEGRPNGYVSYRSHIWSDTDPARTGMLPFVFEGGFGYERYIDYALDVPMYFVYRDGRYIDAAGLSFRDFLEGRLSVLPGEKPRLSDWVDHLSTAFPEVRLKSFLEMRGADGGRWSKICALPALWVGLLYDQGALDAAWDEVKGWSIEDRQRLRDDVPKLGLKAMTPAGEPLRDLAQRVLAIAEGGLAARARLNAAGDNESGFLDPLREIVARGTTPAEVLLERYRGEWRGDVSRVYEEMSF